MWPGMPNTARAWWAASLMGHLDEPSLQDLKGHLSHFLHRKPLAQAAVPSYSIEYVELW